jgi:hypothetical protein
MRRFLQLILIVTSLTGIAGAQTSNWPGSQSKPDGIFPIDLVTVAEPTVRQKCRIHEITPDSITCGVGMLRDPVVYKRDDVAALIMPRSHAMRITGIIEFVAGAACLAGSFFVGAGAVVILMEVLGGFSTFVGQFNAIFADDMGMDQTHDKLIYQGPYTTLSVAMH